MKRFLLAAGGTGGHIFPALRTAAVLRERGHHVVMAGALQKFEKPVQTSGIDYVLMDVQGLVLSRWTTWPKVMVKLWSAWRQSHNLFKKQSFDAVIGFGGYSSFPVMLAAAQRKLPMMLHEQNVIPGRANRWLSRMVRQIALTFPESQSHFPNRSVIHTGCPSTVPNDTMTREDALARWGLDSNRYTILVAGGSQGSERINEVVLEVLRDRASNDVQVIHMAGPKQAEFLTQGYAQAGVLARVEPFIDDMCSAYTAADLLIARSGAGMVNEAAYFRKKAIFIPYPHAQHHQLANARVLERLGVAKVIEQTGLSKKVLEEMIFTLKDDTILAADNETSLNRIFLPHADVLLADALESLISI